MSRTHLPILTFEDIRNVTSSYMNEADFAVVARAYEEALQAHAKQVRKSGEPYIQHPLHVCLILAKLKLDPSTLAAAFLHDVVEDTSQTISEIRRKFGRRIALLVDGVTNLDRIEQRRGFFAQFFIKETRPLSRSEQRTESLRKMLLATSKDIRVVLIKLADRLHNMETLESVEKDRQQFIAQETLEIYAPLAYRLGIGTLKGRLEDLAFSYVSSEAYQKLVRLVKHEATDREKQVERVRRILTMLLAKAGIKATIHSRVKHYYSLYKKLQRYDNDITKIYDLVACRIIVETTEECYRVLGLIHKRWKPFEGRVKDYIASPKSNGYQSLHTTVRAVGDRPIEIQIRTEAMHQQAEYGIAAHWHYSEQKGTLGYLRRQASQASKAEFGWVAELARWQRRATSYKDFDEMMKIDFFGDRIFPYTPKGDVIDLPVGATPIDFAYSIHTEIGNHLSGAKVNGKMTRLGEALHSGDTVELLVSKKAWPKRDWLAVAKTTTAKARIRRALRQPTH